jgi:hypothetical protein
MLPPQSAWSSLPYSPAPYGQAARLAGWGEGGRGGEGGGGGGAPPPPSAIQATRFRSEDSGIRVRLAAHGPTRPAGATV